MLDFEPFAALFFRPSEHPGLKIVRGDVIEVEDMCDDGVDLELLMFLELLCLCCVLMLVLMVLVVVGVVMLVFLLCYEVVFFFFDLEMIDLGDVMELDLVDLCSNLMVWVVGMFMMSCVVWYWWVLSGIEYVVFLFVG